MGSDYTRIGKAASAIRRRLGEIGGDEAAISEMDEAELDDLAGLLRITSALLEKYEHKSKVRSLMAEFACIAEEAAESLYGMEAELGGLAESAEGSVRRLEEAHLRMRERLSADALLGRGGNNLTKSCIQSYTG